ncbi:MAG: histidinol-phosphatase [Spirochaetota bacterium]|jgi:chromosome segregation protein|nr:histidinol-phosphatase [Spirochaetota bacterium]
MPDEIKTYNVFKHGSTWLRSDFHLHTMADKQFVYTGEENSFLNDYVTKLKQEGINIGVITNHNKFNKDEFVNLRKKARKEEIFLLPGVELSVNDGANGIHTLVVFSDEWIANGNDYINPFITTMFPSKSPFEYENEDGRSDKNILQVVEELEKTNRDYFMIFAHVEQRSGLWVEMKGGKLGDFTQKRYSLIRSKSLAFQKVRTRDDREKVKTILNGWYPAEVEGSDCKSIGEIGSKDGETWLKIGDFTFEAVKYALVDYQNRVRSSTPERYKHSHIRSISFEGGTLGGQIVHFSPELNTFIGIRGSGKSSILEAVRYVLDYPFGEKATDKEYKNKLVAHTLGSGGKAIITAIDQYGSEFQIRRILNEYPEVYVNNKLQPGVSIRETVIRNPIYFGQKDLSASGEGFEKDLVEKLVGESLYDIRRQIEEKKQIVSDTVLRLQKVANIDEQIADYTQRKQDAEFNLGKFKEYGIEEKFKKQTDFDTDERKIKQILADIDTFRTDLDSFISQHEDELRNHQIYTSQQNQSFFSAFLEEFKKIIAILDRQKSDSSNITVIKTALSEKFTDFSKTKKTFTDEFAETRRKIEAELKEKGAVALNLEEYPTLKGKIDTAVKMLDALHKQKSQAASIKNELLQALTELNNLWQQEFQAVKVQLDKINNKQSSLTIEPKFKGDKTGFLSFMKNVFRGSGIRENTLSSIVNEYSDFGTLYRDFENARKKAGSSPETFEKYFFDNLKDLLVYQVQNKFTIKYRGKELQHHSLGQRASALILFVLNQQENDLIIVDQPEDDLDNQTIYEDVIKLIRNLKPHTQFLFATHNANFPVLGDAEQIHSCRYEDDKITIHAGSIDSPVLQKEIVDIMEGGEDAFNKRKEIYGIWKPQNL